jgi:hypothetical protein
MSLNVAAISLPPPRQDNWPTIAWFFPALIEHAPAFLR